jgi:hypothetical protein
MARSFISTPQLSGRVYRAIVMQALPYAVCMGVIGTLVGLFLGTLASLASLDKIYGMILALYTVAGFLIGTAIGIRPVFRELMAFHWSADVHAR